LVVSRANCGAIGLRSFGQQVSGASAIPQRGSRWVVGRVGKSPAEDVRGNTASNRGDAERPLPVDAKQGET
jgi:hypothetical protein